MKKIFFLVAIVGIAFSASAQKVYSTKTGQVKFTPFDKNLAVNDQVQSLLKSDNGQIAFSMLIKGFKFDNSILQDHFNENYMESSKFPNAKFQGFVTNIKEVDFAKNGTYNVTVKGNLTIHGTSKEITAPGTIEIEKGKVIAKSTFKVKVKEYGIKGLYIGEKISSEIDILVNCSYE